MAEIRVPAGLTLAGPAPAPPVAQQQGGETAQPAAIRLPRGLTLANGAAMAPVPPSPAAPASGPIEPTPLDRPSTWSEAPANLVKGAIQGAGTGLQGLAALTQYPKPEVVDLYDQLAATGPQSTPDQIAAVRQRIQAEGTNVTGPILQSTLSDRLEGQPMPDRLQMGIGDPRETAGWQTGQQVIDYGRDTFPTDARNEDRFVTQAFRGAGTTVPMIATSLVPGGTVLTGLQAVAGGAGQQAQDAAASGASGPQIAQAAVQGTLTGIPDIIGVETMLKPITTALAPGIKKMVVERIYQAIRGGAVEGSTEAVQQAAQNLIAHGSYDPGRDPLEGVAQAGLVGAAMGGAVGGLVPEGGHADQHAGAPAPAVGTQQPGAASPGPAAPAVQGAPVTSPAAPSQVVQSPQGAPPAAEAIIPAQSPAAAPEPAAAPAPQPVGPTAADVPAMQEAWVALTQQIGTGEPTPEQGAQRTQLEDAIKAVGGRVPSAQPIVEQARAREKSALKEGMRQAAEGGQPVDQLVAQQQVETGLPDAERSYRDAYRLAQQDGKVSISQLRAKLRMAPSDARALIERLAAEGAVGPAKNGVRPFTGAAAQEGAGTQAEPIEAKTAMDVDRAAQVAEVPTEAQAEAGNYQQGHLEWDGLPITVETPRNSQRTGVFPDGTPWSVTMPAHYGYIKTHEGADGDKLDVFLGPDPQSPTVFMVDQIDPATGEFDEHKAILGAKDEAEARALYEGSFSDGSGPSRMGAITAMPTDEFKRRLDEWNPTQPLAYHEPEAPADPHVRPPSYLDDFEDSIDDMFFSEPTAQGQQNLIPGVAPVTDADRLNVQANAPLAPAATQRPADDGLFDIAGRGQMDLVQQAQASPSTPPAAAPRRKGKKPTLVDRMENYYQVGREVPSYGGSTDEVVSFNRGDSEHWSVTVRDTKTGQQRRHETIPDKRPLDRWEKEHPVGAAPAAPQQDVADIPDRIPFWLDAVKKYRSEAAKRSDSLIGFIRSKGGLKRTGPSGQEVRAALKDAKLPPGVFNAKGLAADDAALAAWEAGYLPGETRPDLQTFYDALTREARGEPVHTETGATAQAEQSQFVRDMDQEMVAAGATADMTDQQIAERMAQHELTTRMEQGAIPFALGWDTAGGETDQGPGERANAPYVLNTPISLTPEQQKIQDRVQAIIDRIIPGVSVKTGGYTSLNGVPQEGIQGGFSRASNTLAVTRFAINPENVGNHEGFHGLREMLTPEEWSTLMAAAPEWRQKFDIDNRYSMQGLSEDKLNEEGGAHAFGEWAAGRLDAVPSSIDRIFNKIRAILSRIRRAVRSVIGAKADINDIFSSIESGEVAARRPAGSPVVFDQAMFALTPKTPQQNQSLRDQILNSVAGGPKLPMPGDLMWHSKFVSTPYHLASVEADFEPVFDAQMDMNERRSRLATKLFRDLEPYFRLSTKDKDAVNAVLETGRLQRQTYGNMPTITVTNIGAQPHTLLKPGQSITLTERQAAAYRAVRTGMDNAVRAMRNQFLVEQGFGKPGDPRTPGQFRQLAQAATTGREQQRLLRIADTLDTINEAQQTGYVPFTRYGDHFINVRDMSGNLVHSEKVDSGIGRRRRNANLRQKLEAMYPAGQFKVEDTRFGTDPKKALGLDRLDFQALGRLAEQGGADAAMRQAYEDALRQGLNEAGFRSHFITSSNLPGYSQDFERSIADYVLGMSGYLGRRATRSRLNAALDSIPPGKKRLKAYAEEYARYTTTPTEEYQKLRSWMFYSNLAGNIGSAMVNLSQMPLFSYPWLTLGANPARSAWEMARAGKDVLAAFRPQRRADTLYFDPNALPAADRAEMQALLDEGTLVPQATIEQMGVAQSRNRQLRGIKKRTQLVTGVLGTFFGAAERYNRMVTALAMLRMMRDPKIAAQFSRSLAGNQIAAAKMATNNGQLSGLDGARMSVDETQFVQGKVNRPATLRGLGSVFFQFKQFTLNALQLEYRMATKYGARGKAAFALHLGLMLLVAGAFGIPGADDLKNLIETLVKSATGKDLDIEKEMQIAMSDIAGDSELGNLASEAVRRGMFRGTGVDVSRRIGMGNVAPGQNLGQEATGFEHFLNMSPLGGAAMKIFEAANLAQKGDLTGAGLQVAPLFLSAGGGNAARAYVMSHQGQRSREGDMLLPPNTPAYQQAADHIQPGDVALRALGFQSTHLARAFERYGMENRIDQAMSDITRDYARALAISMVQGDGATTGALRQEIAKYNIGKDPANQVVITPQRLSAAIKREREGINSRSRPHRTAGERERLQNATPQGLIYDSLGGDDVDQ
jgi:Inorganic Pyrophosphatase